MAAGTRLPTMSRTTKRATSNSAASVTAVPVPMTGETQAAFFLRASRGLRTQVPSVNRRTAEILRIWQQSPNDQDLRDKGQAMFPPERFVHSGPRCIFIEHTIPASDDGHQPAIVYAQAQLQQMVDWANYRIRNSDNFAAISDGHTPSTDEKSHGASDPEVLGYAGPFYLGLLGDMDPKWAIYADEWVHRDDVTRFEKLQRRSPEVWANEPMEARTMDPIAALGAATPRLDSGMNPYCRASDGRVVVHYSAMTFPGPMNTFIPSAQQRTKQRYSGESAMTSGQEHDTDDLQDRVSDAISALMPTFVQAVVQAVQGGTDGVTPPSDDEEPQPDDPPAPRGMDDPAADDGTESSPAVDVDDPQAKKYKAMGSQCYDAYLAGRRAATKYRRQGFDSGLARIVSRQADRIKGLETSIAEERRDVMRYQRLNALSREYAFDAQEELDEICAEMTDPQFERHCTSTVVKYSRRDDLTGLDLYDDPTVDPDRYARGAAGTRINADQIERYSRQAAAVAAKKNAVKRGSTTFEAEFDAICRQHGVSI